MKQNFKLLSLVLAFLLLLATPVSASQGWEPGIYVNDQAGLLTSDECSALNSYAQALSEQYDCGIYIMTVWDFTTFGYGSDVFEATWKLYHSNLLGYGSGNDGLILLLSMAERDYALFVYGQAEYAFDSYGQILLEDAFLDNFRNNDWYGGFSDYLSTGESMLSMADRGEPVRKDTGPQTGVFILIAVLLSALITGIFWAQMRNVRRKSGARAYVTGGGLNLTHRTDLFLRKTRTVRHIPKSSSSGSGGGGGRSGGGGSGRSGKF